MKAPTGGVWRIQTGVLHAVLGSYAAEPPMKPGKRTQYRLRNRTIGSQNRTATGSSFLTWFMYFPISRSVILLLECAMLREFMKLLILETVALHASQREELTYRDGRGRLLRSGFTCF